MKTDRFSDSIRRKLESIRPDFTENDWTRMQATLRQAAPPQPGSPVAQPPFGGGIWSASPWLLAAATVSTVVLIAFSIWQRSEINQLRDTVGQLKHQATVPQTAPTSPAPEQSTVAKSDDSRSAMQGNKLVQRPEPVVAPGQKLGTSGNRDTVYVDRYVVVPSPAGLERANEGSARPMELPPQQPDALTSRTPVMTDPVRLPEDQISHPQTSAYSVSSTPLTGTPTPTNQPSSISKSVSPSLAAHDPINASRASITINESAQLPATSQTPRNDVAGTGQVAGQRPTPSGNKTPDGVIGQNKAAADRMEISGQPADIRALSNSYELATGRPFSTNPVNWNALLIQRARRLRTLRPSAPVIAKHKKASAGQPVERIMARNRLGAGSEFNAHTWSAGVFTELMLNKHWSLSLGLSQATYLGGLFITADDFDAHTRRNFKQEFGRGLDPKLDPKGDILNVDTRMVRLQIPLNLTYRIPIGRSLTLLPTAGTYLNLSSTEKVTFYYRRLQRGFDQANLSAGRSVDLLNILSLGAGLEWQSKHWVVQGSSIFKLPTQPNPGWQKGASVGLRARLLYQL